MHEALALLAGTSRPKLGTKKGSTPTIKIKQLYIYIHTSPMDPMGTGISIHKICMTTGVQPEHRHCIFSTENPAWEPTFGLGYLIPVNPEKNVLPLCLVVFLWKKKIYIYILYIYTVLMCPEPNWPLFFKVNPPKEGHFQSKQGSLAF